MIQAFIMAIMREGQNECYGNRLICSVPGWSWWGGGGLLGTGTETSPYGACRERERERERYKHRDQNRLVICV